MATGAEFFTGYFDNQVAAGNAIEVRGEYCNSDGCSVQVPGPDGGKLASDIGWKEGDKPGVVFSDKAIGRVAEHRAQGGDLRDTRVVLGSLANESGEVVIDYNPAGIASIHNNPSRGLVGVNNFSGDDFDQLVSL